MTSTVLALAATTLLAYAVKAATGFGPALVVVSLGSLLVGPVNAVILAAFLDLASGIGLAWIDRQAVARERWIRPAATMAAGAIVGSLLLGVVPTAGLTRLVGLGVVVFGVWLLWDSWRSGPDDLPSRPRRPARRRFEPLLEHAAAAIGGVSGGVIGVGGPPLIIYYGSRFPKERFRAILVPVLVVAAFFRAATYSASGQLTGEIGTLVLVSLPTLPAGLWLGNRLFRRIPEDAFRRVVALVVTIVGLRLAL